MARLTVKSVCAIVSEDMHTLHITTSKQQKYEVIDAYSCFVYGANTLEKLLKAREDYLEKKAQKTKDSDINTLPANQSMSGIGFCLKSNAHKLKKFSQFTYKGVIYEVKKQGNYSYCAICKLARIVLEIDTMYYQRLHEAIREQITDYLEFKRIYEQ